jgi:hypothetical protein
MTNEVAGTALDLGFTGQRVSFITDVIIAQRYVELDGALRTVLAVVKMRGGAHSHAFREYTIGAQGAVVGRSLSQYQKILTGFPEPRLPDGPPRGAGLTTQETAVLDALVRLREASTQAISVRTGLPRHDVEKALERLEALDYAVRGQEAGEDGPGYRAVVRGTES